MSSDVDSDLPWDDEWPDNITIGARKLKRHCQRRFRQQSTSLKNVRRKNKGGLASNTAIGSRRRTWQPKRRTKRQSARLVGHKTQNDDEELDNTTMGTPWPKRPSRESKGDFTSAQGFAESVTYIYKSLPPDSDGPDSIAASTHPHERLHTRVVKIYQGDYYADIEIDFKEIYLKNHNDDVEGILPYLEYDALSYVWGSEEEPGIVTVRRARQTITITKNLDVALRHLRYPDRPRYMWIDALCIDQGNNKERSRQVSYMSHIFWNAPRVIIWLGTGSNDSNHALDTLDYIGSQIRVNWITFQFKRFIDPDDQQWGNSSDLDLFLDQRQTTAVTALMQREWFERLWIRQEAFKAESNNSIVVCGTKVLPWSIFRRGLFCVVFCRIPCVFREKKVSNAFHRKSHLISSVLQLRAYTLENLHRRTVGASCKDARDRIYALLGILDYNTKRLGIVPDYGLSPSEIYQDITLRYLATYGCLDLLSSCYQPDSHRLQAQPSRSLSRPSKLCSLPTWVPNWSSPVNLPWPLHTKRESNQFRAYARYLGHGNLQAAGVSAGPIQHFIELNTYTHATLAESIREAIPSNALQTQYPGGGNLWDAFRITLCAGTFYDQTIPLQRTTSFSLSSQDSKEAMRSIAAGGRLPEGNFLNMVRYLARTGRFFITQKGYLGWGPVTALKGDQPVSFLGCERSTLIRGLSSPNDDFERFIIVAPCYLCGFMDGEAFLGPLPDYIRPLLHLGTPNELKFHNSRTGDINLEDPRLKALPIDLGGYRRQREKGFRLLLNIEPATWQSWGIDVVDFILGHF